MAKIAGLLLTCQAAGRYTYQGAVSKRRVDGSSPWNVKSNMSGSERVRNAFGKDRLISSAATDGTDRLPCDDLFAASVRTPTTFIDQPNLAERPLVQSITNGSVQAPKCASDRMSRDRFSYFCFCL